MVEVVPSVESLFLSECVIERANGTAARTLRSRARQDRLIELRKAIARGEYQVPAGDLADALLHSARSAS